tara:strand:+ start:728 stop:1321 length:594 start_codon:yes stop_codon:yes gene_type:complete
MVDESVEPGRAPGSTDDSGNARFAINLFIVAEIMFFGALVGMYIVLRLGAKTWKPEGFSELAMGLPLGNLAVLVLSGFFILLASRSIRREDPIGLVSWLCLTLVSGAVFAGVQFLEFSRLIEQQLPAQSIFGTVFYSMAGLHGLHVVGGVLLLSYVMIQAIRGKYQQHRRIGVDLALYYWLMVVLVWVFFFGILYIL